MLAKTIKKNGKDWHDQLPYALWAYRTSEKITTGATPYSLMYGDEAIIPLEVEILSLRIALKHVIKESQQWEVRLCQLEELDERRINALEHLKTYQQRIKRAYGKKMVPKKFEFEDMVL